MALLIHLPLNGNLTNSGTATDATITADGATVNNNGRNGQQCYYFNNTRIVVQSTQLQNIFASASSPSIEITVPMGNQLHAQSPYSRYFPLDD